MACGLWIRVSRAGADSAPSRGGDSHSGFVPGVQSGARAPARGRSGRRPRAASWHCVPVPRRPGL